MLSAWPKPVCKFQNSGRTSSSAYEHTPILREGKCFSPGLLKAPKHLSFGPFNLWRDKNQRCDPNHLDSKRGSSGGGGAAPIFVPDEFGLRRRGFDQRSW